MIDFYDPNRAAEHLDSTYDELMNGAQLLAEAFFIEAKDELEGDLTHIPIVISLRKHAGKSTSINWARMYISKGQSKGSARPVPRTIPRKTGKGKKVFTYPHEQFSFLQPKMKRLVLHYEAKLATIRELANTLLETRRRLLDNVNKANELYSHCVEVHERVKP